VNKFQTRILQIVIVTLIMTVAIVSGQTPPSYTVAMWTFDKSQSYKEDKQYKANYGRQVESSSLSMFGGDIEKNGSDGKGYTDNCGIQYQATEAIRWKDVRGENDNIVEDDAQLQVTVNTIDWKNLVFRFFYRSENTKTFDLSYHLGDGNWKLLADNVVIDAFNKWNNIAVGLEDVPDIENRTTVVLLVHDLTHDSGRGKFSMDNIAVVGQRISSEVDCPPILEALTPINDIMIMLNSDNIPTFTNDDGFQFQVTDDETPFAEMTIVALSSDPNIINQFGLTPIDPDNGIFRLDIGAPYGYAGVADLILRVTDGRGSITEQVIKYGVSDADIRGTTYYHQGTSQASAGVAVNDSTMVIASDDNQQINVYHRNQAGLPITTLDLSETLDLGDRRKDNTYPTVDIEAGTQIGNRQFWLGSHSNSNKGKLQPNRFRLFATETHGQGDNIQLSFVGYYGDLFDDLDEWGGEHGYKFKSMLQDNRQPDKVNGFNIEGFAIAPDGQTAYIGFRTPLVTNNEVSYALVAPLQNFSAWFNNGNPTNPASFGNPILLNLGGLGIRGMECNTNGCVIIAGSIDDEGLFAIYSWSGNLTDAPVPRSTNLADLQPESVILSTDTTIQLISDSGDTDWYHIGKKFDELPTNLQFFRSDYIVME
jgi:hypothetical protein